MTSGPFIQITRLFGTQLHKYHIIYQMVNTDWSENHKESVYVLNYPGIIYKTPDRIDKSFLYINNAIRNVKSRPSEYHRLDQN